MTTLTAMLLALVLKGKQPIDDAYVPSTVSDLAEAAEKAVETFGPLKGFTKAETVAVLLVTADEESQFRMNKSGDGGKAHCAMQVWNHGDLSDPENCMLTGLKVAAESLRMDPSAPLAQY